MTQLLSNRFRMLLAMALFAFVSMASAQNPQETLNAPVLNSVTQIGNTNFVTVNFTLPEQTGGINMMYVEFYMGRGNQQQREFVGAQMIDNYVAGTTLTESLQLYCPDSSNSTNYNFVARFVSEDSLFEGNGRNVRVSPFSNQITATLNNFENVFVNVEDYSNPFFAVANQPFTFDLNATVTAGLTLSYRLQDEAPEGVTIDPQTGVINWTPTQNGYYVFSVFISVDGIGDWMTAIIEIYVTDCVPVPVLNGTVYKAGTTEPIERGVVFAVQVTEEDSTGYNMGNTISTMINNGSFTMNLPAGTWKVGFDCKHFGDEQWYQNANSFEAATPLVLACGQTMDIVAYVNNENEEPQTVVFSTFPEYNAQLDTLYAYDADANAYPESSTPLVYELIDGPEGMTINAETGLLTWTPTESGYYFVAIRARIAGDSSEDYRSMAYQQWTITVRQCETPGTITCSFYNESGYGNPLGRCPSVDLMKLMDDGTLRYEESLYAWDSVGIFTADAGTYYLYITERKSAGHYYPNSPTIEGAEAFVINCGDNVTVNIPIGDSSVNAYVTVSGSIRLRGTEELVPNGTVTFIGYSEDYGDQVEYSVVVTNGEYSIELPNQYIYMAYVDFAGERPTVYYPGTTDPMRAEAFWLGNDDAVINFNVPRNTEPRETYQINGSVVNQNNEPLANMIVIAYLISNPADSLEVEMYNGWAGNTNANGTFEIPYLIPGEYVLFAISPAYNYVPGYYLAGQTAVIDWQLATRIQIGRDGSTGPFVITVAPMAEGGQGLGEIGGSIYSGSERGVMSTQGGASSVPVSGASIYAKIEGGSVVKVTSTSSNGAFKFSNLANGTYEIYAGKIGFGTLMNKVTISDENLSAAVNMTMQPGFTPTEEVATSDITIAPNPVSSMMNIKFAATAGTAKYTVFNALGEQVAMGAFSTTAGENTHSVDVTGLSAGMYIVRVIGDDVNFSASFSVIR